MKVCYFCGYDEAWIRESPWNLIEKRDKNDIHYVVQCNVCHAVGPESKTRKGAEAKWDGVLKDIDDQYELKKAIHENYEELDEMDGGAIGGVSSPMVTLTNVPGVGNAVVPQSAAMSGTQQTSSNVIGSGDKWGNGPIYDQKGKVKTKKLKKTRSKKTTSKKINAKKKNTGLGLTEGIQNTTYIIDMANFMKKVDDDKAIANYIASKFDGISFQQVYNKLLDTSIEDIVMKYSADYALIESNLNPYDQIGAMMAKKMGVPQPFKKKDSRTNTVEQKIIDNVNLFKTNFNIETLDDYSKACKHVPDHPLTLKKKKVNEADVNIKAQEALKNVKSKATMEKLGIPFVYKAGKSGTYRVFIKDNINDVIESMKENGWEETGKNPENTIKKFTKNDKELTIYAEGDALPRVTLKVVNETIEIKVVSNSLKPYVL